MGASSILLRTLSALLVIVSLAILAGCAPSEPTGPGLAPGGSGYERVEVTPQFPGLTPIASNPSLSDVANTVIDVGIDASAAAAAVVDPPPAQLGDALAAGSRVVAVVPVAAVSQRGKSAVASSTGDVAVIAESPDGGRAAFGLARVAGREHWVYVPLPRLTASVYSRLGERTAQGSVYLVPSNLGMAEAFWLLLDEGASQSAVLISGPPETPVEIDNIQLREGGEYPSWYVASPTVIRR